MKGGEDKIRAAVRNPAPADEDPKSGKLDQRLAQLPLNDSGNGERFRARHGRNLLSVPESGRYYYTGSHWSRESGDQEWAFAAQKTAQAILQNELPELKALEIDLKSMGVEIVDARGRKQRLVGLHDEDKAKAKRDNSFRRWAEQSGNLPRLEAMQTVSDPFLTKRIYELDADPLLFNVQNGTLELGNKQDRAAVRLRRHSRLDYITRIAPIGYDPEAQCPRFHEFIVRVVPNRNVRRWMQKFLGYSLTGAMREHILVLLLGEGRNGKGTLVRLCLWLWGEYAATISFASLSTDERRSGSGPSPDIARLPGVRLVFAAEPRKGSRLDDGRSKELTGGDRQLARHLNLGFFEFDPQFKLCIQANNRPRITDTSTGMWERMRLVPFEVVIPEDERDQDLIDKLKAEGPGFLNWCLDGYRLYCDEGLSPPAEIVAATQKYRSESDEIARFLTAATVRDPKGSVRSSHLYDCYVGWAQAMDLRAMSQTKFGTEISERGYEPTPHGKNNVIWRFGLRWSETIDWRWEARP